MTAAVRRAEERPRPTEHSRQSLKELICGSGSDVAASLILRTVMLFSLRCYNSQATTAVQQFAHATAVAKRNLYQQGQKRQQKLCAQLQYCFRVKNIFSAVFYVIGTLCAGVIVGRAQSSSESRRAASCQVTLAILKNRDVANNTHAASTCQIAPLFSYWTKYPRCGVGALVSVTYTSA